MNLLTLFIRAVFVENLALAFFLGICTLLGASRRVSTATGLGVAIMVVMLITIPVNHLMYVYLLAPGAWSWAGMPELNLSHLSLICFIGVIAAIVQILEMVLDRYFPALFSALGVFLPLIAVNCAILGGSLFMVDRSYSLLECVVYAAGGGIGWALAVTALAAVRERVEVPASSARPSSGALTFVVVGIICMAFMAFSGVRLP